MNIAWAQRKPGQVEAHHNPVRFARQVPGDLMDLINVGIADAIEPDGVLGLELSDIVQHWPGELGLLLVDVDYGVIGIQ